MKRKTLWAIYDNAYMQSCGGVFGSKKNAIEAVASAVRKRVKRQLAAKKPKAERWPDGREKLEPGTVIQWLRYKADVIQDRHNEVRVRQHSNGMEATWDWNHIGHSCTIISRPGGKQ